LTLNDLKLKTSTNKMPSHYKGTKTERRALNAYINLTRAANTIESQMAAQLEVKGLSISQFGTLEALYHLGPLCQHEIAAKLLKSGGNITMVISNLEKQGWIKREHVPNDRRLLRIHLTPAGRRQAATILPPHVAAITKIMRNLTNKEQESLRNLCRKLGRGTQKVLSRHGVSRAANAAKARGLSR
jgi:MarR family 2-MHQ and catechol resistance regulon transcriptional repressor